jgi:hypothetical protein
MVHYVAPGSADGKYPPAHRAAVITEIPWVGDDYNEHLGDPNLIVFNPTGIHFPTAVPFDPTGTKPYSWHWPERVGVTGIAR